MNKGQIMITKGSKTATPGFSIPAYKTCPGASEWCRKMCYASKGRFIFGMVKDAHERNFNEVESEGFIAKILKEIPKSGEFRIHVAGDFYSVNYIQMWIDICNSKPDIRFWAYSRSWVIPELRIKLEELKVLPNVEIFASIDSTMLQIPPEGWRIAAIKGDSRFTEGVTCPEQLLKLKKRPLISCKNCRYCFDKNRKGRNVLFFEH